MPATYRVKLEIFEGPFDLLYHLVQKDEIDIWDIPIARVTDQYLSYLDAMRELNVEVASEFVVMAARLLRIKARMLLPEERKVDEEDNGEDPRLDLAAALMEYALFKEAAARLDELGQGRWAFMPRPEVYAPPESKPVYDDPAGGVGAVDLAKAFANVLASVDKQRPIPIPYSPVSVAEKVASLHRLFTRRRQVAFSQLFPKGASRPEVVATFLALLELIRRGHVYAEQSSVFGPIQIYRREEDGRS